MLITTYDYWGYYNICYLAGEVRQPEKNIPRAVLISISLVAVIYLLMNVSVLGVIPWQEFASHSGADARSSVISFFMQRIYGGWAGKVVTGLIIWTAFGSVFSLLLGYSRVPYAAALDGNYFARFCAPAPAPPISLRFAAGSGSRGHRVLRFATGRRDCRSGGDPPAPAISAAGNWPSDSAPRSIPRCRAPSACGFIPSPHCWRPPALSTS